MIEKIDSFVKYIQYEKAYSSHTVSAYQKDLFLFYEYLKTKMDPVDLHAIDRDLVRSYLVFLGMNKEKSSTVNRKLSSIKSFFKYLLRAGVVSVNPVSQVNGPKKVKNLPVFVKEDEMDRLFDSETIEPGFEGIRDFLILYMFYTTGIRCSELIELKEDNVDLCQMQLKVFGKRKKERIIPFGDELAVYISRYLDEKHIVDALNIFLFIDRNGKKLSSSHVYQIVKSKLSLVTTVQKKSPHILRHTFATVMLNNGAELNSVKELLGHASLASTEVYTHVSFEEMKSVYKSAHPRALKKGGKP